jgi:hypothetical protein
VNVTRRVVAFPREKYIVAAAHFTHVDMLPQKVTHANAVGSLTLKLTCRRSAKRGGYLNRASG